MTDTHNVQQSPPRLPKLTPLPVQGSESIREWNMNLVAWIYGNWDDIESIQRIIAAQDEPSLTRRAAYEQILEECERPHPTNCACPDCEPDEKCRRDWSLVADVRVLQEQSKLQHIWLRQIDERLDTLEQPKPEPVAEPSSAPPPDICEEWAIKLMDVCNHDTITSTLRRLGLPERQAVCDAVRKHIEWTESMNLPGDAHYSETMQAAIKAVAALDAKEKSNGKA